MNMKAWALGSASAGTALIGLTYLISPQAILDVYGVSLQSVNAANLLRGAYGGLFVTFAALFCAGAVKAEFARPALLSLLAFMGGLAIGRIVSLMTDGIPHPVLIAMFIVEVFYACVAVRLLTRHRDPATHGTGA